MVAFSTQCKEQSGVIKGAEYPYNAMIAYCQNCNEELDVYNDENLKSLYDAYRGVHRLISLEKIREIPIMYGIGKRMLSLLLGWGELTFTRYYDGYLPTKQYSDVLQKLYDNPLQYQTLLEEGKNSISETALHKSKRAIQKLLSVNQTQIMKVTGYLQQQKRDLSSYRLQKLLYYIQGVSALFCSEPLFLDPCEAWENGPVYREVFLKYKNNAIDDILGDLLADDEKEIINGVLECFGRYDGDTLVLFTHNETPWTETRGDLPADAPSDRIIPLESIIKYFTKVRDDYKMTSITDMKQYAHDMFKRVC
jgi:uncharacterized phage-associated protein